MPACRRTPPSVSRALSTFLHASAFSSAALKSLWTAALSAADGAWRTASANACAAWTNSGRAAWWAGAGLASSWSDARWASERPRTTLAEKEATPVELLDAMVGWRGWAAESEGKGRVVVASCRRLRAHLEANEKSACCGRTSTALAPGKEEAEGTHLIELESWSGSEMNRAVGAMNRRRCEASAEARDRERMRRSS